MATTLLRLLAVTCCLAPAAAWAAQPPPPNPDPPKPGNRLVIRWKNEVIFASNPTKDGPTTPGLSGRLYLYGKGADGSHEGDGSLRVELYEAGGAGPRLRETWHIDPETLGRLKNKDAVGWGYSVFLPWGTYSPDVKQVHFRTRYQPKDGPPVTADSGAIDLVKAGPALAVPPPPEKEGQAPASTDAEKIARLQRTITAGEKELAEIKKQLSDPDSEYHKARAEFKELDDHLTAKTGDLEQFKKEGKRAEAEALEKNLAPLRKKWQQARDRFDLAIQERKTLQEKAAALPEMIRRERTVLERLSGTAPVPPMPMSDPIRDKLKPAPSPGAPPDPDPVKPSPPAPGADGEKKATQEEGPASENAELKKARDEARTKEEAARAVRDRAQSIGVYIELLRRDIEFERRLLETARKRAENARKTQTDLAEEKAGLVKAGAPRAEVAAIAKKIAEAIRRQKEATAEAKRKVEEIAAMEARLQRLQSRAGEIRAEADQRGREADDAHEEIARLQNPFTPHNVLQWLLDHGGKLLAILCGIFALHVGVRVFSRRIVRLVVARSARRNKRQEAEDRAETLVGVFRNSASLLILGGGTLMLLDEVGIPIVPLMGGAAVFGLAVAFGAQNLIKDYFSGFMILMEDQYGVNDVVQIGDIAGKVERISLRMTVLRDLEGVAHFVPHGTITTVSNMTHGWSRALLDVRIAYKEDADQVMRVLLDLCAEMRRDERFGPLILDEPEMLGVDALTDSAVLIRFFLKTRPLRQWDVKRELLRRIKKRFDQMGIEIPFPHRTVYHRREGGAGEQDVGDARAA